jgi:hypothetical protein
MDSDPEPRSPSTSPALASAQGEDTAEDPPSPLQSAAIVLGPLIAAFTLVLPFGSVIADRFGAGPFTGLHPQLEQIGARSDQTPRRSSAASAAGAQERTGADGPGR